MKNKWTLAAWLAFVCGLLIAGTNISGEIQGGREPVFFGRNSNFTASGYLNGVVGRVFSTTHGYVMPRAGSIVGISAGTNVSAQTTPGNVTYEVRKNGVNVFSSALAIAGAAVYKNYATQARGVDTFSANDVIAVYLTYDTFAGTINGIFGIVELQFDT